ncbi:MAG TPA: segregation/condensation protein A [Firmicutes bacterium]|nr:segregation/condensation protein A [Bacillota bacterium]
MRARRVEKVGFTVLLKKRPVFARRIRESRTNGEEAGQPEYKIKLDVFEGPLDLLLYLIERAEIDIYDIPIAYITDEYLAYLRTIELLDLYYAGDFLVMASTLMQIKARMLLPRSPETVADEEEEEEDPRRELVERLLEYKKVKEAAAVLRTQEEEWSRLYYRSAGEFPDLEEEKPDDPLGGDLSLWDLIQAFRSLLESFTPRLEVEGMPVAQESVQDRMEEILERLSRKPQIYFSILFSGLPTKKSMVTCFLAILELIRMQRIRVRQDRLFGDIEITRAKEDDSGLQ